MAPASSPPADTLIPNLVRRPSVDSATPPRRALIGRVGDDVRDDDTPDSDGTAIDWDTELMKVDWGQLTACEWVGFICGVVFLVLTIAYVASGLGWWTA
jgi:hypothetical protein